MRGGAFLNGKEGRVGFRKKPFLMGKSGAYERKESSLSNCRVQPALSKKKDGLILENLLIPLYHDLSLFLPGKLLLSFLTILRKEPQ